MNAELDYRARMLIRRLESRRDQIWAELSQIEEDIAVLREGGAS